MSGLRSYRPVKRVGPRAFGPPDRPLPPGNCTWCGEWFTQLERDHVLPRSLFPGVNRDAPDNLVPACQKCNRRRSSETWKPDFGRLPRRSQSFALAWFSRPRLVRMFSNVAEASDGR